MDAGGIGGANAEDGDALADFTSHEGVGEFVNNAFADADGLRPILTADCEFELDAEIVAGLADDATGDFFVGFGFTWREVGIEFLEEFEGLFRITLAGGVEELLFEGFFVITPG